MSLESTIREIMDKHLADPTRPDVSGLVDQFFGLANKYGSFVGTFSGDDRIQFSAPEVARSRVSTVQTQTSVVVKTKAARATMRMICARLGAICHERSAEDLTPYGADTMIDHELATGKRLHISFINTPERQEFLIETA